MADDTGKSDALVLVRKLELEAYGSVVTALRAQGDLAERGKTILDELRDVFSISEERHKAEMRRVANDDTLASLAEKALGNVTCENWLAEGKRTMPPLPRIDPQTAYTRLATTASKKQMKVEMAKFFETRDLLERAIKKQEESRATLVESDRMETKRRLAELAPVSSEIPSTSDEPKNKPLVNVSHRKRVRVCSPQPSPGVDADLGALSAEPVATVKVKKSHKEPGAKKQRLRMSPSGNSSVQENVPADEASGSLPPSSLAVSSPVKVTNDALDPISPLATPGQLVRNIDLFANQSEHGNDVTSSAEKFHKSPPKSPKQPKEKKPKQTKKQAKAAAAAPNSLTSAPLKSDSAENAANISFSSSPPVTFSGISATRTSHHSIIQQQAAAVAAAAAQSHHHVPQQHAVQHHPQTQQPGPGVVISSTSHGQLVVSSPPAQGNLVHASPGKAAQSSYHNYAPPLAPLSINPMRLVGRAGPGAAISTAAASPPSIAVNTFRPQDAANIPLIRLTPQNPQQQPSRPPLIVATGGGPRPTAILTPGAPGVPGVLTIRSHRPPTLTPVTTTTPNSNVRPSIVIHQAPAGAAVTGVQPAVVMRRVGPSASAASATTPNVPTIHSSVSASAVPTLPASAPNRSLYISSGPTPGANGSSVLVISKQQQQQLQMQLQQQPPTRPTIISTPNPPPQQPHPVQQVVSQSQVQANQPLPQSLASLPTLTPPNQVRNSVGGNYPPYPPHFQPAAKQVSDLYTVECDMSSPPAVGAESIVETSHDLLSNGTAYESNNGPIGSANGNGPTGGLDLLHQAAESIDAPSAAELGAYMAAKDLSEPDLAFGDIAATFHPGANMTSAPSHDSELYNEDLMMAIMNNNTTNGQHRQSQPS